MKGNILLTGGTGSLGTALVQRALRDGWDCTLTIYSRDEMKQQALARRIAQTNPGTRRVRFALGDVADYDTLERVMVGHDTVIHAAAFKHIPAGELNVGAMMQTNLVGSQNVVTAALRTGVKRVLGISTDKACAPVNAYGATKMLMERIFQEANSGGVVSFHLVRYGNVIDSTGSVVPLWKKQVAEGKPLTLTDPHMTRFWLGIDRAVQLVVDAFSIESGKVLIPHLHGLSMGVFADYCFPGQRTKTVGLRPGEKMHECLLTAEEGTRAVRQYLNGSAHYVLSEPDAPARDMPLPAFTSDMTTEMKRAELLKLLALPVDELENAVAAVAA